MLVIGLLLELEEEKSTSACSDVLPLDFYQLLNAAIAKAGEGEIVSIEP